MGKRPAPSPPGIPFWLCRCVGLWYGFPMLWPRMPHRLSAGRPADHMRLLPRIFPSCQRVLWTALIAVVAGMLLHSPAFAQPNGSGRVALDFNEVDLSVFVRFISELTGKNFVLDDTVKKAGGKISVFSPTKVTPDQAYHLFVSALEVSRLAVVPRGPVYQIVPMGELPPERGVFVYKLKHANATDLAAVLTNLVARSQTVSFTRDDLNRFNTLRMLRSAANERADCELT